MANESDYKQQWSSFLSCGGYHFSEELLTPDIALIVSPDGSKISVIGDDKSSPLYAYDEQEQAVYVNLFNGGSGTSFNCPACERSYVISFDGTEQVNDGTISIPKKASFFDCACGVVFVFSDRYEFLSLPFDVVKLAPLHNLGMSQKSDLFLRYVLEQDGRSLVEEVGILNGPRLTDDPSRKFLMWGVAPCFTSIDTESVYTDIRVHDVQIWRKRIYVLGCDRFAELTWHPYVNGWERVDRYHDAKKYIWSGDTPNSELLGKIALLEAVVAVNENPSPAKRTTKGRPIGSFEVSKEVFREYAFRVVEKMAADPQIKRVTKIKLADFTKLHRFTVNTYLERDPGLMDELQKRFLEISTVERVNR